MSKNIRNLEPTAIWNHFADLNAIPRPSKKEQKVREHIQEFAKNLNLETKIDSVGNLIIKKPATKGMQNRKAIVMQSHLDMVCQKNNETDFDFETQGINVLISGDWVTAVGTTLGADNGLGVAAIMSVLESTNIAHPALEALFTVNEESGMTGALGLQSGYLNADILLNLDTEDDKEIAIGCAGGIDISARLSYIPCPSFGKKAYKISILGLRGGHSGIDIHKGYANANKLMNRILFELNDWVSLAEVDGGSLRNAIPRESVAIIVTSNDIKQKFDKVKSEIMDEFHRIETNIRISIEDHHVPDLVLAKTQQDKLLKTIYATHNGVYRMSPDIMGLVETSNNLAKVLVKNGSIEILNLTRSATEVGKMDLVNQLRCGFELGGFNVSVSGSYPGWKPNPDSKILELLKDLYQTLYINPPKIMAYHAGLECGILGTNYPNMDMISFGPTIQRAHSPDERASISSTQKFWSFLLEILKNIPENK
jgi:dipeptidase D